MTRICLLIALAFTTAIHAQIVNPTNGHTYVLTPTTMTFAAARAYAPSVGGYLAAINDASENAFVTSNFAVVGGQPWIGLTDEAQEGVFHWDSGEALTYTNWAGGQPDNYLGNENYVELAVNGVWNDLSAAYTKFGIIEIPLNTVFNPGNGNTYVLTPVPDTIYAGRIYAASIGGHLATISDASENAFLVGAFGSIPYLWIGLSDENVEGTWTWDDGAPVTYTNWRPWTNEPNGGIYENHALIMMVDGGRWNDGLGTTPALSIVELEAGLGPCAVGNVGVGQGGPYDVLFVNGSSGAPTRQVDVPIATPIAISVAQPPTNIFPALFAIVGFIGVPTAADVAPLPFNVGTLCFPSYHLNPGQPGLFVLTNNYGPDAFALVPSTPAPWSITVNGLPFPFQFTLQGVINQDPVTVRVTNGVLVNVQ